MGYKLDVTARDERLLQSLQARPQGGFPHPYAAYVLFLFTNADREHASWLSEHLELLDAITGDTLAFAVFAERLELEITPYSDAWRNLMDGSPLNVGSFEAEPSIAATRLVNQGASIVLHEHLTAITQGTAIAARALRVTSKIPCVVVFDGAPMRPPYVVSLPKRQLPDLRRVFQNAIEAFEADDNHHDVQELATDLWALAEGLQRERIAHDIDAARLRRATARAERARLQSLDRLLTPEARRRAGTRYETALAEIVGLQEGAPAATSAAQAEVAALGRRIRAFRGRAFTDCLRREVDRSRLRGTFHDAGAAGLAMFYKLAPAIIGELGKPPGAP